MQAEKLNERRQFCRIIFDAIVTFKGSKGLWQSELIDISLNGVLVERPTDCNCESGDSFDVNIQLDGDICIKMNASVAHMTEDSLGLACDAIDLESITHLRQIVEQNAEDESLIHRELHCLGRICEL